MPSEFTQELAKFTDYFLKNTSVVPIAVYLVSVNLILLHDNLLINFDKFRCKIR